MAQTNKSVLLKTSAKTDVQYSGGKILIAGLDAIKQTNIVDFSQINYRAEVQQVVRVGTSTYTPIADTKYTILIGDRKRRDHGFTEQLKAYSYTTPSDLTTIGANAAAQREAIHLALIAKINATANNYCSAATLTGGAGIAITDDPGYYPYNHQGMTNRQGANLVFPATNADGTGFAKTDYSIYTAAVYSVGVGADLANNAPVIDFMTGNLISGELNAPKTVSGDVAVSGQKYNMFSITSLEIANMPTISGNYKGYSFKTQQVWVDNGKGTDTTNLAGYIAFAKEMHRGLFKQYAADPSAQVDFFDNVILLEGALGAAPATTGTNKLVSDSKWTYNQIGTQTIVGPVAGNTGLLLDQDLTDTEGAEYTPSILTGAPQEFVVGKTAFSVYARLVAADWTDMAFLVGFRKKAAYQADFNNYTDLGAIGSLAASGDLITTQGILNDAATVSTSTGIAPVDAAYLTVEVLVDLAGVVTCKLNDVAYPVYSVGTTPLVFDAADVMIPFVRAVNIGGGDPDFVINEFAALPTNTWKA